MKSKIVKGNTESSYLKLPIPEHIGLTAMIGGPKKLEVQSRMETVLAMEPAVEMNKDCSFELEENQEFPFVNIVEDRECGGFRGHCELELSGAMRAERLEIDGMEKVPMERVFSEYVAELEKGVMVTLLYRRDEHGKIFWHITGRSEACAEKAVASKRGEELRLGMTAIMESMGMFRFKSVRPAKLQTCETACPWRCELIPEGISLDSDKQNQIGFGAHPAELNRECMRLNGFSGRNMRKGMDQPVQPLFQSIIHAVQTPNLPLVLELTFSPFFLSGETLDALTGVLTSGIPVGGKVQSQKQHGIVCASISHWAEVLQGYHMRCTVKASQAVPDSLLRMLGKQVFGELVCVEYGLEMKRANKDLRGHYVVGNYPSPFLPSGEVLLAYDAIRHYNRRLPVLAKEGLQLGYVIENSKTYEIRLEESERSKHCYLVGATGTGKSTVLENMVYQDIAAGRGVCAIDPHGDLYENILRCIPASRMNDVVLMDFSDRSRVVGFNLLDTQKAKNPAHALSRQIGDILKVLDDKYNMYLAGGPMFELYFRNALLLIGDNRFDDGSIVDMVPVFTDPKCRELLMSGCRNPQVVRFFKDMADKVRGDGNMNNIAPYIVSKLNKLIENPIVRAIVGQPKTSIDFQEIIDSGKILLINLSKGGLGMEGSNMLGTLIIQHLFASLLARADMPPAERKPCYIYVDEFQNFVSDTAAQMLAEVRKYGGCLTLANQTLGQLKPREGGNLKESVLGNVGTLISFRCGPDDAPTLETFFMPQYDRNDLQNLPVYTVVGRIMHSRLQSKPFVFNTLPPVPDTGDFADVGELRRLNRCYTTPIEEVEKQLANRW